MALGGGEYEPYKNISIWMADVRSGSQPVASNPFDAVAAIVNANSKEHDSGIYVFL